jgi:hypothetical protein
MYRAGEQINPTPKKPPFHRRVAAKSGMVEGREGVMDKPDATDRLHQAIKGGYEAAAEAGLLEGSVRKALESALVTLDDKLGGDDTGIRYKVDSVPDHCVVILHSADPVGTDIVASFLHHAGANKLGAAKAWLLPLGDLPVKRWIRGLRRVIAAERHSHAVAALPLRLTVLWPNEGELVVATVG